MRMFQYKISGNMRLKCEKRQRHLLVYVDGWTIQKKPATKTKVAETTRNSNFPISKYIQDSN